MISDHEFKVSEGKSSCIWVHSVFLLYDDHAGSGMLVKEQLFSIRNLVEVDCYCDKHVK